METGAETKRADATECAHCAVATAAADGAVRDDGIEDSGAQVSLALLTLWLSAKRYRPRPLKASVIEELVGEAPTCPAVELLGNEIPQIGAFFEDLRLCARVTARPSQDAPRVNSTRRIQRRNLTLALLTQH